MELQVQPKGHRFTWALMGENGRPVECDSIWNSEARGRIFPKKLPEIPNWAYYLWILFHWSTIFFDVWHSQTLTWGLMEKRGCPTSGGGYCIGKLIIKNSFLKITFQF